MSPTTYFSDRVRSIKKRKAQVDYRLKAKEDLSGYTDQIKGNEELSGMDRFAMIMTLSALRMEHGNFKKGDTFQRQRVITFRDSENGWMPIQE